MGVVAPARPGSVASSPSRCKRGSELHALARHPPILSRANSLFFWGNLAKRRKLHPRRNMKAFVIWEEVMPRLVGFGTFAALLVEQISEISRRISWRLLDDRMK